MKANGASEVPSANTRPPQMNGAAMDRVSENDKTILDIKARMRKLRTYEEKLNQQSREATEKIKELIKSGQKERAIIHLKRKKFTEAEITKCSGAQIKMQELMMGIESAQADLQIFSALKEGDAVLKDLHSKVSIADWEELYADH